MSKYAKLSPTRRDTNASDALVVALDLLAPPRFLLEDAVGGTRDLREVPASISVTNRINYQKMIKTTNPIRLGQ